MLQPLIACSIKNSGIVVGIALLFLLSAIWSMQNIPVDVFPELNAPTVTIITESDGLSAEEVEQIISFPIETAVNGLQSLRRVRSSSSLGLSIVWAEFDWGTDIYLARQMISERLASIEEAFPKGSHVQMTPISSITGEIMMISLKPSSSEVSEMDVRAYAEFELRNHLLTIPGVAQVVAIGGHLPEYQVEFDQDRLRMYDLSAEDLASALSEAHNLNSAGFLVNVQGLEWPIRQGGRVRSIDDIKGTVVQRRDGVSMTIGEVADVRIGGGVRRGSASDNGESAVVMSIQKSPGTNTLSLTESVDQLLDQMEGSLPNGMILNRHVFRQSDFIQRSVDNVSKVLLEASVIVAIVLMLFLFNVRATLITLLTLPVSLSVTLILMTIFEMTINVMTLGGLAVAIGILVDDSIIDVENAYRRLAEKGCDARSHFKAYVQVIYDSSNEIRGSIIFATLIICMVFIPLLFLDGLEGRFFQPLGLTYMISVMVSLLVAMTLTPALCFLLLKSGVAKKRNESALSHFIKRMYAPVLSYCIRFKKLVLLLSASMAMMALSLFTSFGSSFLPEFNEGTYTVFLMMPPGTSLEESERVSLNVQKQLLAIDGVAHIVSRSGRAERDEHAEPPSNSELEVRLVEGANSRDVLKSLDEVLSGIPGVTTNIGQPISHRLSHVMSGTKAQVALNIYGDSLPLLRTLAEKVKSELIKMDGTRDVAANREVLVHTMAIDYRREDLERFGLRPHDVGAQVKRALYGEVIQEIYQGAYKYDLVLRHTGLRNKSLDEIGAIILEGDDGVLVRLHEVANIGPEQASNLISRQNGRRKTVVSTNIATGHNLGDVVERIKETIAPIVTAQGAHLEISGQFEAQQSAQKTMVIFGGLVGLIMILMLKMALGDFRSVFLVMLNLPLAMIGGVLAMFWVESSEPWLNLLAWFGLGRPFVPPVVSVATLVGFITLFGISVRNGILLVNHFRWLMVEEGLSHMDAVLTGARERLIPVLMTALSAMLGLIPLARKMGEPGSELLAPLAVVVLGGLFSSTALNMLVVPVGHLLFCGGKSARREKIKIEL